MGQGFLCPWELCPGAGGVSVQFSPTDGFGAAAHAQFTAKRAKTSEIRVRGQQEWFVAAAREGDAPQAEEPAASWAAGNAGRRQEQDVVQGSGEGAVAAWHTWVCTCGLLPAQPGCTGSAREGRLPGKCPQGRDGQGCAPCPARKALPRAASPAQLQLLLCSCLGTVPLCSSRGLSEFLGWREFPGKAAHPWGWEGSRAGLTAAGVSLGHIVLCPSG